VIYIGACDETNYEVSFIPDTLGKMTNLKCIGMRNVGFTGRQFITIGCNITQHAAETLLLMVLGPFPDISALANLERLYLNDNKLTGVIPASIGKLRGHLRVLRLSNNTFSGVGDVNTDDVDEQLKMLNELLPDCGDLKLRP
jgi:Leucine-rich repeat (LRR) protein